MPPPTPAALQSVSIPRTEIRSSPSPHTVYAILVSLPVRTWTVYRRYSEFLALHAGLCARSPSSPPPAPFPPKQAARRALRFLSGKLGGGGGGGGANADEELTRERQAALERYLRAIVASPDAQWRQTDEFKAFLELPRSQRATAVLGAHARTDTTQTDTPRTDPTHTQTNSPPPPPPPPPSNGAAYARWKAGRAHPPGGFRASSSSDAHTAPFSRRLGSPSSHAPPPAEETSATRALSSRALLSSQEAQFASQDAALADLAAVLRRQRQMGTAINQELLEQNEVLDALDGEVQGVQGKLQRNEGLVRRLG